MDQNLAEDIEKPNNNHRVLIIFQQRVKTCLKSRRFKGLYFGWGHRKTALKNSLSKGPNVVFVHNYSGYVLALWQIVCIINVIVFLNDANWSACLPWLCFRQVAKFSGWLLWLCDLHVANCSILLLWVCVLHVAKCPQYLLQLCFWILYISVPYAAIAVV